MNRSFTLPIFVSTTLATLFLLAFIFLYLFNELQQTLRLVIYAGGGIAVLLFFAGLVIGIFFMKEKQEQAALDTAIKKLMVDEYKIKIVVASRTFHNASAGDQVYEFDAMNQVTTPLHLQAGPVNGHYIEPSDLEIQNYRLNQLAHATARRHLAPGSETPALASGEQPQVLRPILPFLVKAQRSVIVGPSGSGKTTLLQHLVHERARFSKIILIDPHGQKPKYGSLVDAVGCGMRFDEIDQALRAIDWLMVQRYQEIAAGADHRSHSNVTLIIDELMAIVDEKQRGEAAKEAATVIKRLATQARKAAIDVFLIAHSLLVGQTGLKGASDLLSNFTVVELHQDLDENRSCYLHVNKPAGRKELIECAMPGPFDQSRVVIHPDQILALPPAPTLEEIKIIDAIRANPGASFGKIASIVGLSNSTYTNQKIKAVIEKFGLEQYEIGLKSA